VPWDVDPVLVVPDPVVPWFWPPEANTIPALRIKASKATIKIFKNLTSF
jgi:hypothetical protein